MSLIPNYFARAYSSISREPGELIELDDELIEDISLARLTGEDNACIAEETSIQDEEENDIDDLIAM